MVCRPGEGPKMLENGLKDRRFDKLKVGGPESGARWGLYKLRDKISFFQKCFLMGQKYVFHKKISFSPTWRVGRFLIFFWKMSRKIWKMSFLGIVVGQGHGVQVFKRRQFSWWQVLKVFKRGARFHDVRVLKSYRIIKIPGVHLGKANLWNFIFQKCELRKVTASFWRSKKRSGRSNPPHRQIDPQTGAGSSFMGSDCDIKWFSISIVSLESNHLDWAGLMSDAG